MVVGDHHLVIVEPSACCRGAQFIFKRWVKSRRARVDKPPAVAAPRVVAPAIFDKPIFVSRSNYVPVVLPVHPRILAKVTRDRMIRSEEALVGNLAYLGAILARNVVPDGQVEAVRATHTVACHLAVVSVELLAQPASDVPPTL